MKTESGKEFLNKIKAEVYQKLDIKGQTALQHIPSAIVKQKCSTKPWPNL
jgi:hypothetical protein